MCNAAAALLLLGGYNKNLFIYILLFQLVWQPWGNTSPFLCRIQAEVNGQQCPKNLPGYTGSVVQLLCSRDVMSSQLLPTPCFMSLSDEVIYSFAANMV